MILLNLYVFYLQVSSADFEQFTYSYAFIPADFDPFNLYTYRFILYSIFMHGGFLHILSNMWILYIFGDNVEDRLGHIPYLLFYLAGGIVATLGQYFLTSTSVIPMIGASGAIAAVIGAYLIWYHKHGVKTLVPTFLGLFSVVELPVWFYMGYWVLIQLLSGFGSLVAFDINEGGIAWFAHIGGFVFGFLFARLI